MIDRTFLLRERPNITLLKAPRKVSVRPVGNKLVETDEYVAIDIFVPGNIVKGTKISTNCFTRITIEAYLVDNLNANILLRNDILGPHKVNLCYKRKLITLIQLGLTTPIDVQTRMVPRKVNRTVRALQAVAVPAHSAIQVPTRINRRYLPNNRDYVFEPSLPGAMPQAVDSDCPFVIFANTGAQDRYIQRNRAMGYLIDNIAEEAIAWTSEAAEHHIARLIA